MNRILLNFCIMLCACWVGCQHLTNASNNQLVQQQQQQLLPDDSPMEKTQSQQAQQQNNIQQDSPDQEQKDDQTGQSQGQQQQNLQEQQQKQQQVQEQQQQNQQEVQSVQQQSSTEQQQANQQPIIPPKPPSDIRQYEAYVLSNQLRVLFIHNRYMSKSACSMSVGVGSLYNLDNALGVAHFLEHMLFMGSEKYPGENQFSKFIQSNSGSRNAYTSELQTNFYFQIKNNVFFQAFQRLSNFFISPLLNQESIDKQRQAVHNQFSILVSDDGRRRWEVLKNQGSLPYSRFSAGNKQTLGYDTVRDDLQEFYNTYYSSNIMNVVVFSNYTIRQMKQVIIPLLEQIPNKNVELPELGEHFTSQQTAKLVRMKPIKGEVILGFYWPIQQLQPLYKSHVVEFVNNMLRNQGKNSLIAYLRLTNYASKITSNVQHLKSQSIFFLELKLTSIGEQNYQQVYNIVMDYMEQLQSLQYIYNEIKQKNEIQFQYKEKMRPPDYVTFLSSKMQSLPVQQVLNYLVLFQDYEQAALDINRVLGQMRSQNLIVIFANNVELQNPIQQNYFGIIYQVFDLPERQIIIQKFQQIPQNPYMPINIQVIKFKSSTQIPTQINQDFYFMEDSQFEIPKGGIQLRVYGLQDYQFTRFYARYLELLLIQITYPASFASCQITITADNNIMFNIFGFSDTVIKFLEIFADSMREILDSDRSEIFFNVALNDVISGLQNYDSRKPDQLAQKLLQISLRNGLKTIQNSLEQLRRYEYLPTVERIKNFWRNCKLKWVVVGNFKQQSIASLIQSVKNKLIDQENEVQIPSYGCLQLSKNLIFQRRLDSQQIVTSSAIVYYQAGPYSEDLNYKLMLLKQYIDQPYFTQLRTNKQLAYSLNIRIDNTRGVLGMRFILTSSTHNPKQISDQIKQFVGQFFGKVSQSLNQQNSNDLEKIKMSLFTKKSSPLASLISLFMSVTSQISQKTFYYNRRVGSQMLSYLTPITAADLQDTWDSMKQYSIEIFVVSSAHRQQYQQYQIETSEIDEVKQEGEFYDDYYYCCN